MLLAIPLLLALAVPADFIPQYVIDTVAGSDASGDNSMGTSVPLLQPEGVAVARNGDLYFADADDHRVRRMDARGIVHTVAGTGLAGFSGDGGAATEAQLNRPYGLALDTAGDLYIADLGNARVRRVDANGIIKTVAGGGIAPFDPFFDSEDALSVQFISPRNVAVAADGSFYISDFDGQRVYRVDASGSMTVVTGTGVRGFFGDDGDASQALLAWPAGLAVDAKGALYIADSGNGRVRRVADGTITTVVQAGGVVDLAFDRQGTLLVAADGMLGNIDAPIPGSSKFGARSLALNRSGNIVFSTGTQVQAVDSSGARITIVGLTGAGAWGDGGPGDAARFATPTGCVLDTEGNLFIADTGENRIREVSAAGIVSTVYGNGDPAMLNAPRAVAIALDGSLLIADTGNGRLLKQSAGVVTTLLDHLSAPSYLFVAPDGVLYIAETAGNRVTVLATDGTTRFLPVNQPVAVVEDAQQRVYVAQAGSGQLQQFDSTGWGISIPVGLGQPAGLALDSNGNMLIADSARNNVVSLAPSGIISVIAGTGTAGFAGDGGLALSAQFNAPSDVKVASDGRLFVVDSGNNRIRVLTPQAPPGGSYDLLVVNAASFLPGAIASDEIVSLFGLFDPATVTVQIGGLPATLFYAGPSQLNALVPHSMAAGAPVDVVVLQYGVFSAKATLDTAAAAPALFTTSGGTGQAAALNPDGTANLEDRPCPRGGAIILYGTGFGPGALTATIGDSPAVVISSGPVPDYPGLMEVTLVVPNDIAPSTATAVLITAGSVSTRPAVTISVM